MISQDDLEHYLRGALAILPPSDWLPDPDGVELFPLSAGAYHLNFHMICADQHAVVRVNRTSQWGLTPEEQLGREFATLMDLVASGVTPRPLAFIAGSPPALIESFIDGGPFLYGHNLASAAASIAAVHRQLPRQSASRLSCEAPEAFLLRDGLEWLRKAETHETGGLTIRLLREASTKLPEPLPSTTRGILHTDLTASNLLVTNQGCSIVDWEGARIGSPEWDLAYFLSPVTTRWAPEGYQLLSERERIQFLETYSQAARVSPVHLIAAVARIQPLVIFRALCWCVGFEATEKLAPDVANRLMRFTNASFVEEMLKVHQH